DNYTFAQPGIQKKVKALEELVSRIDGRADALINLQPRCFISLLVQLRPSRGSAEDLVSHSTFSVTFSPPSVETVHRHMQHYEVEYLQFAFRWMNNLLMRELPLRCTIRLWDTYQKNSVSLSITRAAKLPLPSDRVPPRCGLGLLDWFGKWCQEMKGVWDARWRSRPDVALAVCSGLWDVVLPAAELKIPVSCFHLTTRSPDNREKWMKTTAAAAAAAAASPSPLLTLICLPPQAEPEGFSHFHLYVCAAFLVRWRKEILEERDFQPSPLTPHPSASGLQRESWSALVSTCFMEPSFSCPPYSHCLWLFPHFISCFLTRYRSVFGRAGRRSP
ncbi:TBC1 domain family member 22B, partial [Takifugu flavidus]